MPPRKRKVASSSSDDDDEETKLKSTSRPKRGKKASSVASGSDSEAPAAATKKLATKKKAATKKKSVTKKKKDVSESEKDDDKSDKEEEETKKAARPKRTKKPTAKLAASGSTRPKHGKAAVPTPATDDDDDDEKSDASSQRRASSSASRSPRRSSPSPARYRSSSPSSPSSSSATAAAASTAQPFVWPELPKKARKPRVLKPIVNPEGVPLVKEAIVPHLAEIRCYHTKKRPSKVTKTCGGCHGKIGPGTIRVHFPQKGSRHLRCWHSGLGKDKYYTASCLEGWRQLKDDDREKVSLKLRQLHITTSADRVKAGKIVYGYSTADFDDPKRWNEPGFIKPVATYSYFGGCFSGHCESEGQPHCTCGGEDGVNPKLSDPKYASYYSDDIDEITGAPPPRERDDDASDDE